MVSAMLEEDNIGNRAACSVERLSSRFEFVFDHDRSGFLGVAIRLKALPIVRLQLGAAGETYNKRTVHG
jgi:hypothetical protein